MTPRQTVARSAIVLTLFSAFVGGPVAPASSSDPAGPAANGLVLFEGFPNVAEFLIGDDSLGPNDPLYDLWAVDPIGGIARNLTNTPGVDSRGAWSPDGTRIAFVSNRGGSHDLDYEVYVMNADGSAVKKLTKIDSSYASTPEWSPDGRRIAFVMGSQLWVMRADGKGERMIFREPSGRRIWLNDWSPDGRALLFGAEDADSDGDIWMIGPNGSGARRLIASKDDEWGASFSPDGKKIAFSRATFCETVTTWCLYDLFVADRDGGNATNITNTPHISEESPTWSPDGSSIAYTGDVGTARFEMDVWVIGAEGGVRRPLTLQPRTWDLLPDWQPVDM